MYRVSDGTDEVVHRDTDTVVEAPNWTSDGRWLVVNADGKLWRIPAQGGDRELIDTGDLPDLNNDHVVGPDGRFAYVSCNDGHFYEVPLTGSGSIRRVSNDQEGVWHFLHGISPDGTTLAYIGLTGAMSGGDRSTDVYTVPVAGGPDTRLTQSPGQKDGCEYSPDGVWIYFNSEQASTTLGHAQLFRMRTDGSDQQQLTFDERVNWFPHLPPDGSKLLYVSFPPGTDGHPENKSVVLRLAAPDGSDPVDLVQLFGGQGTTNVNGWAPDSDHFAYVSYPILGEGQDDSPDHERDEPAALSGTTR